MSYTLANILTLSRIFLNDSGASMMTDAEGIIYANRTCLKIATAIGFPIQTEKKITLPDGSVTPVAYLSMPSDFIRMMSKDERGGLSSVTLQLGTTWTALTQKRRSGLEANIDTLSGTTPLYWYPYPDAGTDTWYRQIGLSPQYTGTGGASKVSLNYVCFPTELTATTSYNELTEHFPIEIAMGIAKLAWPSFSVINSKSFDDMLNETMLPHAIRQEMLRFRIEAEAVPIMQKAI